MKPPHGSTILKAAQESLGKADVVDLPDLTEPGVEEVGGVARLVLWGCFITMILWVMVRGVRKRKVVEEKVVKRGELLDKKIKELDETLVSNVSVKKIDKTDVTANTVAGKQNELKIKPGSWVTVFDDLSPVNGQSVKVLRTDGNDIECDVPGIGGVVFDFKYLKKTPARIEVKWRVHGEKNSENSTFVDPFATCGEVFHDVAKKLDLKQYQFHLISGGKKLTMREAAMSFCDPELYVKVFIIKESFKPGYRPPVEADPGHAQKIYEKLQQNCDALESELISSTTPPLGTQTGDFTTLQTFIQKYDKVIVDFFAPWCGPCRALAPHFSALASSPFHPKIGFFTIDASAHRQAATAHGITAFPTIKTFHKGVVYETMMGADTRRLEGLVENLKRV